MTDHVAAARKVTDLRLPQIAAELERAQFARAAAERLFALHEAQSLLLECAEAVMDASPAEITTAGETAVATMAELIRRHAR